MNDNFVKNFEDATIRFCNVFEECERNVSNFKEQIDELEQIIKRNEQLYKLGSGQKAKDITAESIFLGMSDSEIMTLSHIVGNDRVKAIDDAGNIIRKYDDLNFETKQYFEDRAKQMRAERQDKENENMVANLRVESLNNNLRAILAENYSKLLGEQGRFNSVVGNIDLVDSDYSHEINRCNAEIRNITFDTTLQLDEMDQKIAEQEDKRKKAQAGQAVCKALKNASSVYAKAFRKVTNAIDPRNADYDKNVDAYLDKDNREKIVDELNVLDKLNALIGKFSQAKDNYDEEKALVEEIKNQTKEFGKKHGRGDDFVKAVNSAVNEINRAIGELERTNGVNLNPGQQPTPPTPPTPPQQPTPPTPPTQPQQPTPPTPPTPPQQPLGQQPTGLNGVVADETARAIKIRSAHRCKLHNKELALMLPAVAATGLGILTGGVVLPFVGTGLAVAGAAFMAGDLGERIIDRIRLGAVNHKINSVAKKATKLLKKGNKKAKIKVFPQPDENGVLKYYLKDGDDVVLIDSNLTADIDGQQLVDFMNNKLAKSFDYIKNPAKKKNSRYENLPDVTVDQLNSPYVEFGGYQKGLENRQFGMLGRINANVRDTITRFTDRLRSDDVDVDEVGDNDYQQDLGDGPNPPQPTPPTPPQPSGQSDPIEEAIDRLASNPAFANIPDTRNSISQVVRALTDNYDLVSDDLKVRIDDLITSGTYELNGLRYDMDPAALGSLLSDVQDALRQLQQPPQPAPGQPTTAFDANVAFATLSAKFGPSYPADELIDKISDISSKFDLISDPEIKRVINEALTTGAYTYAGNVIDVTPDELDLLIRTVDDDLGLTPQPQP